MRSVAMIENRMIRGLTLAVLLSFGGFATAQEAAVAADDLVVTEADTLDELLENVRERRVVESRLHTEREQKFARDRASQAKLLQDAQGERRREEQRSDRLETAFDENERCARESESKPERQSGGVECCWQESEQLPKCESVWQQSETAAHDAD